MTIVIREAGLADLEEVLQLRMRLFDKLVDFNNGKGVDEDLLQSTRAYFSDALQNGACKTWVAEADGHLVACGSLAIFIRPPYPGNVAGKDAYLLNMYTMAEYRKQGLARKILQQAMRYAREQGFATIWLHATEDGQALYASEGFEPSAKYMEWEVGAGV